MSGSLLNPQPGLIYINFTPTVTTAFSFQASCDNNQYNFFCPWNTFGQRWYIQCIDQSSNLIFHQPIIGSGTTCFPLASITWSLNDGGTAIATTMAPHGFSLGTQPNLSIGGSTPSGYNGTYSCAILTSTSFSYPVPTYPGPVTSLGAVFDSVNLLAGFFQYTRLIYRVLLASFEVDNRALLS